MPLNNDCFISLRHSCRCMQVAGHQRSAMCCLDMELTVTCCNQIQYLHIKIFADIHINTILQPPLSRFVRIEGDHPSPLYVDSFMDDP